MKHAVARRRHGRTAVLRARVTPEVKGKVVALAEARGADESDVVREAVIGFLNGKSPESDNAEVAS